MPQNLILNKNENINIKLPTESHSSINVFTIFYIFKIHFYCFKFISFAIIYLLLILSLLVLFFSIDKEFFNL